MEIVRLQYRYRGIHESAHFGKDHFLPYQNQSFEEVLQQFEPLVKKQISALRIYKNHDEFFQIGLIGLWEAYCRYNPEKGPFPPFAQATVRGKLLTHIKKENRHAEHQAELSDEMLEVVADPSPSQMLEREIVLSYCHGLTANQRKWVIYGIIENKKPKEIAELEGVPVSHVKVWRRDALQKLRRKYSRSFIEK
ncbi:sigma-70 family RNA polymerase sigma factor [Calidifontibacillus oryziterrae]|uniref:sigma-70 family RNA polymerase sigma factor n=1 Tax=Calidifontibacillus oryziterrae TaxID=1191699 RepID=UPI0002ED85CC|nr:sigma-70 family RNA polymerase sigma factor [Calidifontibacillus oryziterrae]